MLVGPLARVLDIIVFERPMCFTWLRLTLSRQEGMMVSLLVREFNELLAAARGPSLNQNVRRLQVAMDDTRFLTVQVAQCTTYLQQNAVPAARARR